MNLPSSLTRIGNYAFKYCTTLKEVVFTKDIPNLGNGIFEGGTSISKVVFPSTFNSIPTGMFKDCTALTEVVWPQTLTKIYEYAFAYTSLPSIDLPETVTEINWGAFGSNEKITRFVFPKKVEIVHSAVAYCKNLTEVVLPEAAKEITSSAFSNTGIKEIIIPEGVTTINGYAFMNCPNLEFVVLPSTLTNLKGSEIFSNSPSIKTILSYAVMAPKSEKDYGIFENTVYQNAKLYIPQHATGYNGYCWSRFKRTEAPGVVKLENPTFSKSSTLFTDPIMLTLSNPNATGKIYYKLVPEGTEDKDVAYAPYTEPIEISASCKVWAYVIDGYNSSNYIYSLYSYEPPVIHHLEVVVAGIYVDEKNAHDVLGDGKVSYDSKEQVLTLNWADINVDEKTYCAAIQADDGDLTIRVVGKCTVSASAYGLLIGAYPGSGGRGANVTIVGDKNSTLTINARENYSDGIYSYLGNVTIDNCNVVVNGKYSGLFMKPGLDEGILTVKGADAVLDLTSGKMAMCNVQELVLGKMLDIVEPVGAVFENGSVWIGQNVQSHVVIKAKQQDPTDVEGIAEDKCTEEKIYNLQGVRVNRPVAPGVYIVNGKKHIIK